MARAVAPRDSRRRSSAGVRPGVATEIWRRRASVFPLHPLIYSALCVWAACSARSPCGLVAWRHGRVAADWSLAVCVSTRAFSGRARSRAEMSCEAHPRALAFRQHAPAGACAAFWRARPWRQCSRSSPRSTRTMARRAPGLWRGRFGGLPVSAILLIVHWPLLPLALSITT